MRPEQNYIELFESNRALVESGSASLLNNLRSHALEYLDKYGFPQTCHEEYQHTDLSKWFELDWGLNLARKTMPINIAQAFKCNVPNLSTQPFVLANDMFEESLYSPASSLPDGVYADSLRNAAIHHPKLISDFLGRLADMNRPGIAAINTLFAQDGFMLYIPDGITIEKPLQLITLLGSNVEMMVNRRILVVLGKESRAKLLLCDHSVDTNRRLTTQVMEVFAARGSQFELYDLEETNSLNLRTSELYIEQQESSRVTVQNLTLHNGKTRNSLFVTMNGRDASLSLNGIAIASNSQHVDNYTFVDHRTSHCTSRELFKYVLNENAVGAFAGKVLVRQGAQQTDSQQTNRNICLTQTARMFTQPQLEIYADDVKCSHGATVGQLDDKALFYMQQRGIPAHEARMLLILAFVGEVIDKVELEPLRDRLIRLVERRFRSNLNQCEGCRACR